MDYKEAIVKGAQGYALGEPVEGLNGIWTAAFVLAAVGFAKGFQKLLTPALRSVAESVANK